MSGDKVRRVMAESYGLEFAVASSAATLTAASAVEPPVIMLFTACVLKCRP